MGNLWRMFTVLTMVVTSASSCKPVFTNSIVNNSLNAKQSNKDISIQNENNTNPFAPKQLPDFSEQGIGAIAVDKNDNIYVGTNIGLWKSTDGINFSKIFSNDKQIDINDIIIRSQNIYVSTNNDGLWKSTDGINFSKVNNKNYINSLAIDINGNIYAGTKANGLWKSTDGGINFTEIINVNDFINKIIIDNNGGIWFAIDKALYKSTDGINFSKIMDTNDHYIRTLAIDINGNIYAGLAWDGLYKSTDGSNFSKINNINFADITGILITKKQNIYIGTWGQGLWKSTDGSNFSEVNNSPKNIRFNSLSITNDDVIYLGTFIGNGGVWAINLVEQLIKVSKPDTFDKTWPLYNGIVYNSVQKINIKAELVASAKLDEKSISVPTTDLDLKAGDAADGSYKNGDHTLVLILKNKSLASIFGGDANTGQVIYKLWVKIAVDKDKINYATNVDDTKLLTGLVSDFGNTSNCPIIKTKSKDETGKYNVSLNMNFNDILIDLKNSYYVEGTVNGTTNDFTETGIHQTFSKNLLLTNDGIYHLHLVDIIGNVYNSYLELGESNWKLQGKFDDQVLNDKANNLNVTININGASKEIKQEISGWLDKYKDIADRTFNSSVLSKGKGFNMTIAADLKENYKLFLDAVTYVDSKTQYAINQGNLDKKISDIANQKLQAGLIELPQNLNVDTSNVINQSTLASYTNWINNYQKFINNNKNNWATNIANVAGRGYAKQQQLIEIENHVKDNFNKYLQHVVWNPTANLTTSNDYQQFIELDKLQSDTIAWVNTNKDTKDIFEEYQQAMKAAESGLNLHGYSIADILNGKKLPQTKAEIEHFVARQSFHYWLQKQANIKFHHWQLTIGFSIAIPLLLLAIVVGIVIHWRTDPRYNPLSRVKKEIKRDKK